MAQNQKRSLRPQVNLLEVLKKQCGNQYVDPSLNISSNVSQDSSLNLKNTGLNHDNYTWKLNLLHMFNGEIDKSETVVNCVIPDYLKEYMEQWQEIYDKWLNDTDTSPLIHNTDPMETRWNKINSDDDDSDTDSNVVNCDDYYDSDLE